MKINVKLGDVLEYEQPSKYIVNSINYSDTFPTPVLTAGKSFILGYTDETTGVFDNLPVIIFDDFTTAFHYVDFPFKVKSSAMKILKPLKERADIKYLYYKMQTISIDNDLHKRYWISKYSQIQIPLPPLPQQQKIANILDAADALRQKDKALIAKYDELTQSLFLDMFGDPVSNPKGWEIVKLSRLTDITSSRRIFKDEYVENGIPFYRTKEIVELSKDKKISSELFISNDRYNDILNNNDIPVIGDILLSAVGTIGVMWVVNTKEPFYFKDGNLVWLKMSKSKDINSKYLRLTLEYLIEHEKGNLAQGAAYNALTIDKLKKFDVNIAPISLQNQFAERVAAIEAQKAIAQASLAKSEELFNSLLQKAFKGELA